MSDLKPGDALDFKVGDKTLTIEAVPYGQIKKIMRIALEATKEITTSVPLSIPEIIDTNLGKVFPLMFVKGRFDFVTTGWVEDNMTVPTLRKMLEAFVVVNGPQDFFDQATGRTKGPGSPPTPQIPPEKSGSITSSVSVTDGGPKTLTS